MARLILILTFLLTSFPALADPIMDRVNAKQKLTCGYIPYHPANYIDNETQERKGFAYDIFEEVAKRLFVEIEWRTETNWGTMATDLQTGKFDMVCNAYWGNPRSARQMMTTIPFMYQPVFFIKRADDPRFENGLDVINNEDISVSVLEGDVPETILNQLYPKSKQVSLPQLAAFAQVFQEVATKRADLTIAGTSDMANFEKANPGVLKVIDSEPVRVFPMVATMPKDAVQLKNAVDAALLEMTLDGTIETIVKKYTFGENEFYLPNVSYRDAYQ